MFFDRLQAAKISCSRNTIGYKIWGKYSDFAKTGSNLQSESVGCLTVPVYKGTMEVSNDLSNIRAVRGAIEYLAKFHNSRFYTPSFYFYRG